MLVINGEQLGLVDDDVTVVIDGGVTVTPFLRTTVLLIVVPLPGPLFFCIALTSNSKVIVAPTGIGGVTFTFQLAI